MEIVNKAKTKSGWCLMVRNVSADKVPLMRKWLKGFGKLLPAPSGYPGCYLAELPDDNRIAEFRLLF